MSKALIGYTGFVGSNLNRKMDFSHRYNSKNISEIDGNEFDLLVCAGVPAIKWLANKEPENDRKHIDGLVEHLETIRVKKFVLISTIDVYPDPVDVDETTKIDIDTCHAYGRHRLQLEKLISEKFDTHIIRLPGLFGKGLKKNIIYDFLNDNNLDQINSKSIFQFYYLEHLVDDIAAAIEKNIHLLNIATAPTSVADISEICLGKIFRNPDQDTLGAKYDYKSVHAEEFGGHNGYMYTKQQVLNDLKDYIQGER